MKNQQYPPQYCDLEDQEFGVFPVDFLLETILAAGIKWFRNDPKASDKVFGHLRTKWLKTNYGQAKIDEIKAFMAKFQVPIVQHWSLIGEQSPCISIQLLDGSEMEARSGLADFESQIDRLGVDDQVLGRTEVGYSPITDNMHIGVHAMGTPDMVKYLYYLVLYILNTFKPQLEDRGMHLGTFRATDVSRLNDFLPENMFSRFINFSVFSIARFDKGAVPIIEEIIGLSFKEGAEADDVSTDIEYPAGITVLAEEE